MKSVKRFLHHLFIPQETNNYRAKALHLDFLTYYLIFVLFLTFGFKILSSKSADVLGFATDITIEKLYQLTNAARQENQLSNLNYNQQLALAAQKKASDMFTNNYWSHYGPNGTTPWDFILSSGYRYEFAGENLAKNFLFSQGVIDAWLNSPSHKENILRKDYTEVGFAVENGVLNGEETTIVVEMFGKPLASAIAKEVPVFNQPEIRTNTVEAKSVAPTEIPIIQPQPVILAQKTSSQNKNFGRLSVNSSLIFLAFLILTFIMDFYFASKLRIIRISGKNLAHLIFVGFIFLGLIFLTKGSIL